MENRQGKIECKGERLSKLKIMLEVQHNTINKNSRELGGSEGGSQARDQWFRNHSPYKHE